MSKSIVSKNAEEIIHLKHKCSLCSNLLSVPPIFSSTKSRKNICGRCKVPDEGGLWSRNFLYEDLASHLKHKCCVSENCQENLQWNEVLEHERYFCDFKIIKCPCCVARYEKRAMEDHFNSYDHVYYITIECNDYKDCMFTTPEIAKKGEYSQLVVMKVKSNLFLVNIASDNVKVGLSVYVMKCSRTDQFFYEVKLSNENLTISYTGQNIPMFNEKLEETQKHFKWDVLQPLFVGEQKKDIVVTVSVFDKPNNNIVDKSSQLRKDIEEYLECEICSNQMSGQIFQCTTGHSVCGSCKQKLKKCPTCQCSLQGCRNFTLEKIVQKFTRNGH